MFKQVLHIFSIVCFATQAIGDCGDLTLDSCGGDEPFNTLKNTGEEICQQVCRDVYGDKCTFFIYDRANELCELFDFDEEDYAGSCKRIGGTPTPSLADCQESTDPCSVRQQDWKLVAKSDDFCLVLL